MSKLNLKRAPRTKPIETSAGAITLRPLNALDISELVKEFDLETIELTTRIVNHVQSGKPITELFSDQSIFVDLINTLPDLIASAITLCAGGDAEDREAIRELPAEDFGVLTAALVSHSLERIGGLGNLLDLAMEAARIANESFEVQLRKLQDTNSSLASGETSRS